MTRLSLRAGAIAGLLLLAPLGLSAQTDPDRGTYFTPTKGAREFTFGAGGATNKDFDDSAGAINLSIGQYLNDRTIVVFRQSLDYVNPDDGDSGLAASSRLGIDYHFGGNERFRPFVGATFGGIYGDNVEDTWAAGVELGAKYYVKSSTFLFAVAEYSWLFSDTDDLEDRFDDGAIFWNAGIGFNF